MPEIGLFPLPIVLLPGERLPLHIFEPRYRELIGECLDQGQPFGLVFEDDAGRKDIGTIAHVVEVIERLPDGRLNIVVEGRNRFRIVDETHGRSFQTASIEAEPDADDAPSPSDEAACASAFRSLAEDAQAEVGDLSPGPEGLCYFLAARVSLAPQLRQELLNERSGRARTIRLTEILTEARELLRRERLAQERAVTNGRVPGASGPWRER